MPWKVVRLLPEGTLPNGKEMDCPETTLLIDGKALTAIVRGQYGQDRSLLFDSGDFGQSWSKPRENDLPMAPAKIYAGTLSTGQRYVLYNLPGKPRRREIVIAVTRPGEKQFVMAWKICDKKTKSFGNHRRNRSIPTLAHLKRTGIYMSFIPP
jgi:hypothetical protein